MTAATPVTFTPRADPRPGGALLTDLFLDAPTLLNELERALDQGNVLDAFLFGAGIGQILEDHTSAAHDTIRRASTYLIEAGGRSRHLGALVERVERHASTARSDASSVGPTVRLLRGYLEILAAEVLDPDPIGATSVALRAGAPIELLRTASAQIPDDLVRMPSCFRSFDQRPADLTALARALAARGTSLLAPVAVVGVRTSGSYLAPLLAVAMRSAGFADVSHLTIRPGWPVPVSDLRTVRSVGHSAGTIVVVDDPPATGTAIARAVRNLRDVAGLPAEAIICALGLFDDPAASPGLEGVDVVALPFERWDIHRGLCEAAVARTIESLVDGSVVLEVERRRVDACRVRGHVRAVFDVTFTDADSTEPRRERIAVDGAGLGYFGRHLLATADAAPHLFPEVLGVVDGLCYHRDLPGEKRLDRAGVLPDEIGRRIATHIAQRQAALPATVDRTAQLVGRQPAWEIAARILGRSFGRYATASRPIVVDRVVRRALTAPTPSVTDGSPGRASWYLGDSDAAIKVDFAEGPFGHLDLGSYDALSDLAAAAVSFDDPETTKALRAEFERATGTRIDPVRWALFSLVHIWNERRTGSRSVHDERRDSARVLQVLFADVYLSDLGPAAGPLVTVDLDGCLESATLGFSSTTLAGTRALRALRVHGFRSLLATGRSVSEVIERCDAYGLVGGVAEYGAFFVVPGEAPTSLLDQRAIARLAAVRSVAERREGLVVDPDYCGVVRVSRKEGSAPIHGVGRDVALEIVREARASQRVRIVEGEFQTDFVPVEIDKGRALRALIGRIDGNRLDDELPLAAAIGDSESDLSMLALAGRPFAPGNADDAVASDPRVRVMTAQYQLGVADAVARVVGHRRHECAACVGPSLPRATDAVLQLLSLQQGGRGRASVEIARLAALAAGRGRG